MVSTAWRDCRRAERPHLPDPAPRLEAVGELLGEDPAVAGVADRVDDGPADRDVVGLVEVAAAPGVAEVAGDHDVGPVPADDLGDRAPQRDAVLEDAVGQAQELDGRHADDPGGLDLLGLPDPAALVGLHAVDAGLAAGHHAVDDRLALPGPARDRGGGAELHVVGVRDHAQGAVPVLGERLEGFHVHGAEHAVRAARATRVAPQVMETTGAGDILATARASNAAHSNRSLHHPRFTMSDGRRRGGAPRAPKSHRIPRATSAGGARRAIPRWFAGAAAARAAYARPARHARG